jgi:hypothetical protein
MKYYSKREALNETKKVKSIEKYTPVINEEGEILN